MGDKEIEIGTSTTLQVDVDYLLHIQAKPLEFARFLKKLLENIKNEKGESMSQRELAKYLRDIGYTIRQPEIHRYTSIFLLEPRFMEMLENGTMSFTTAYKLSRLSHDLIEEVLKLAKEEWENLVKKLEDGQEPPPLKIYQRQVDTIKRRHMAGERLHTILMKQDDFQEPYETITEEVKIEAQKMVDDVTTEETEKIISSSDLTQIIGMMKLKADEEKRIKPTDLKMYVTASNPVEDLIQSISDIVKEALGKQGYAVY